ncbi:MAG: sigma-70 family RNA polymerase sigma factor [Clostridia bacterium]|nr:sigma-70 family RNA polymerase sigma factor [Clostridia bacterium]
MSEIGVRSRRPHTSSVPERAAVSKTTVSKTAVSKAVTSTAIPHVKQVSYANQASHAKQVSHTQPSAETAPGNETRQNTDNTHRNEENLRLLHRYHDAADEAGRAAALSALTEQNAGLVHAIAARYRDRLASHAGIEYEDLVQIGTIGMIRAVRSFDFSFETTFSTYAVPLIVGEIRRCLRDDGMVKVSRDTKRRGYHVLQEKEKFLREKGREPTVAELSEISGETPESLVFLLDAAAPVASLSEPMAGGDGGEDEVFTLEHVLCEEENDIDRLTERLSLYDAVAKLPQLEQMILRLRYEKQLSQQQTAALLGLSQVKVSRTEKKIFAFLRGEMGQ